MRRPLLPFQLIRVSGPSMVPTLKHGDVLLVRAGGPVRINDVVLARFRSLPQRDVIKRVHHAESGGWHVRSDNEFAAGDSRVHGTAEVLGRVIWVWPQLARGPRRLLPRSVR